MSHFHLKLKMFQTEPIIFSTEPALFSLMTVLSLTAMSSSFSQMPRHEITFGIALSSLAGGRLPETNKFSCRMSLCYPFIETINFIEPHSARLCMAPTHKKQIIQLRDKIETEIR